MSATVFAGPMQTAPLGPYASSSTTFGPQLGDLIYTDDGRAFRYALVGASVLVPGKMYQGPAQITNHQDLTPTATAIGATSVTVTLGNTAATANQYAGGWVMVTVTPGQGYMYRISGHPAASGLATLTLTLNDSIAVALTTSSRVDLVLNPYSGIIIAASSGDATPVGAAVYAAAASTYSWIQTGGPTCLLADGTVTVDTLVCQSNGTAGAIEPFAGVQPAVGYAMSGIATTEYGPVFLTID